MGAKVQLFLGISKKVAIKLQFSHELTLQRSIRSWQAKRPQGPSDDTMEHPLQKQLYEILC